jgi:serine phosphatase RsbU (regulator of sigma subunit)
MAFVVLDPKSHTLTIVNAGHLPPLLRTRRSAIKPLGTEISGLPLGIQPETRYGQVQTKIEPGDSVILATDGVTEAMNPANEIYGTPRLTAFHDMEELLALDPPTPSLSDVSWKG